MKEQEQIADAVVLFYQNQFKKRGSDLNFDILEELPTIISEEERDLIHEIPSKHEVYQVEMKLNRNSADGPNG